MYAGTVINWKDNSSMGSVDPVVDINPKVRYLVLITSDKGPEELTENWGEDWYKLYGTNPDFEKHGQPLLQANKIIEAGGVCVTKRFVADDAALSNVAVVATVTARTREKVDSFGNPLYVDPITGNDTTDSGNGTNQRATENVAVISHGLMALEGAKNMDEVVANARQATLAENGIYPLYVFGDNGRGKTNKKLSFTPEYQVSKNSNFMYYTLREIEGTTIYDSTTFTLDPTIILNNKSYALNEYSMTQVKCETITENLYAFVQAIAEITGYGTDYLMTQDFLFGRTVKGSQIEGIEFDETAVDITAEYGIELQYGDNGSFGDYPFGTDAYTKAIVDYISGNVTDEIYDHTVCSADVVFDANYPVPVKCAIEEFVEYRKDLFFFRDLGLDITSYEMITDRLYSSECGTGKFSAVYCTSYDVYDPTTRKPVQVTMLYNMAPLMVNFFIGGRYRPLCGEANGMDITDYIPGTVRFTPRITPRVNQKSLLEDIRVNYATRVDPTRDNLTIETCYTSQEAYTQASFINNILSIQQVVKAVRAYSPKVRYQFYTSSDFSDYAKRVDEDVLEGFKTNFKVLRLVYVQDEVMAAQKIFKASIEVACGSFIQTEVYDVMILNA